MAGILAGCAKTAPEPAPEPGVPGEPGTLVVTFYYQKQSGSASNQFAVWIEDLDGNLVKTLYATKFTAAGGYKNRPDALAVWVSRAMGVSGFDAVAGATPKPGFCSYAWDLTGEDGSAVPPGTYRFLVEGTMRWKDHVLFTGEIAVGGDAPTDIAVAQVEYFYDQLTADSPEYAMISNVNAHYFSYSN